MREPIWERKCMSLAAAHDFVAWHHNLGHSVVLTNGCFDMLHFGHLWSLYYAAQLGDVLMVAYNDDDSVRALKGEGRPVVPQKTRGDALAMCALVDAVVQFDGDMRAVVRTVRPDTLCKGAEYEGTDIPGADYVAAHGGQLRFTPMFPGISTTRIIGDGV